MMSKKLLAGMFAASLCLSGLAMAQDHKETPKSEPKQEHKDKDHKDEKKAEKVKVGDTAPAFTLTDTGGKTVNLADYKGKIVVLEWFNPGCPVVQMHYKAGTFSKLHADFKGKDVVFLAINSGAAGKQGSGTATNSDAKKEWKMDEPILLDEAGKVGTAYGAKTTPHMFVINKEGKIAYMGAIDNGNPSKAGDKNYVHEAVTELLAGKPVTKTHTESYGCPVKF